MPTYLLSLIGAGAFDTKSHGDNLIIFPSIPAYSDPQLPGQILRRLIVGKMKGDANLAARGVTMQFSL